MRRRRFNGSLLAVAVLGFSAVSSAPGPPVTVVSSASPYADCSEAPQEGLVANSEVEPSLAIDPRDPRRVIVAYQQDRYSRGAARGLAASFSSDGGGSWRGLELPFTVCASGTTTGWLRASDPWVSIGADGRIYAIAVGNGIAVTTSRDGHAWSVPLLLAANTSAYLADKPTLTADPLNPGVAYAVWQRFLVRPIGPPIASDTLLRVTLDGGRSWSGPRIVLRHSPSAGDVSSQLLIDPRRRLLYHLTYWQAGGVPGPGVGHVSLLLVQRSRNGGRTWSRATRITALRVNLALLRDPASGETIRSGVPSFAIDSQPGTLYAAWQDSRFSGGRRNEPVLARSTDQGRTWQVVRIERSSGRVLVPMVAAESSTVAVGYYAISAETRADAANTRFRLATSNDGGRTFAVRPLGPPFALRDAPLLAGDPSLLVPPGLFLGDYVGIAVVNHRAWAGFATANADRSNPTDIRVAKVTAR